jgi:hypothetical protein
VDEDGYTLGRPLTDRIPALNGLVTVGPVGQLEARCNKS